MCMQVPHNTAPFALQQGACGSTLRAAAQAAHLSTTSRACHRATTCAKGSTRDRCLNIGICRVDSAMLTLRRRSTCPERHHHWRRHSHWHVLILSSQHGCKVHWHWRSVSTERRSRVAVVHTHGRRTGGVAAPHHLVRGSHLHEVASWEH